MIATIAKLIVFGIEFAAADDLITLGMEILSIFDGHPNWELTFVMIIVPFILNSLQYWIQDNFLKGTDYINDAKKPNENNKSEMKELHILQDGMIDFKKNR